jgi:two-component system, NarL family, sensor histidine kinase UhpB
LRNGLILGAILFIFAGIFVFRSLQLRRKLEKQQAVVEERKRISADLHDDVGSALSSIRIMSSVAENNPQQSAEMVRRISESSQRMLENMSDIVWTENPDHDSFTDILARMIQYAAQILEPKNIRFKIVAGDEIGNMHLEAESRRNIYLIFKEAVNNLAKYSECTEASVVITGNSNSLTMKITDNGKGFEVNNETSGNGLRNMHRRAESSRGDLKVTSVAGKGTSVELQIPVT